jgi:hypothetical protein
MAAEFYAKFAKGLHRFAGAKAPFALNKKCRPDFVVGGI